LRLTRPRKANLEKCANHMLGWIRVRKRVWASPVFTSLVGEDWEQEDDITLLTLKLSASLS
jgi:hypothetical protein